jgi:hypothetical protein
MVAAYAPVCGAVACSVGLDRATGPCCLALLSVHKQLVQVPVGSGLKRLKATHMLKKRAFTDRTSTEVCESWRRPAPAGSRLRRKMKTKRQWGDEEQRESACLALLGTRDLWAAD